jgi:DUF4097 and DUF4098 domain-containing protein YvlB
MKKPGLLIAILSIAVGAMADNQTTLAHRYEAAKPILAEPAQKPKGDELTEEFHKSYPLSATGRVSIANINGDVHISAWDGNEVKVDAVKRAYSQERLSEATIDVVSAADSIVIKTKYPERNQTFDDRTRVNNPASVEYTLTVPRNARIDNAELINGSLDITGVQGDVHLSLINGEVKAGDLSGDVRISTVNGGVEANLARLTEAKAVNLTSVNGPIVLIVPAGASADVKASTVHGKITNDFGWTVNEGQYVGRDMAGQVGSGGLRIRLSNVNGSISIKHD